MARRRHRYSSAGRSRQRQRGCQNASHLSYEWQSCDALSSVLELGLGQLGSSSELDGAHQGTDGTYLWIVPSRDRHLSLHPVCQYTISHANQPRDAVCMVLRHGQPYNRPQYLVVRRTSQSRPTERHAVRLSREAGWRSRMQRVHRMTSQRAPPFHEEPPCRSRQRDA
jgi:hypothetical protein